MLIDHLSVSRTGCFEQCQQQYKYRYHLKVIPDKPEQIYFTYGKLVHKAAEIFVENKGAMPMLDIVRNLLNGSISFEGSQNLHRLNQDYHRKLWQHTQFIEKFTHKVGFDGELEYKMEYDLDPPNNKKFLGFIDRLIIKNDKAIIIDYKTSKNNAWRKTKQNIGYDLQLNAYALYVHEHFKIKPEDIQAALVYLEDPQVISTNFTEPRLIETKQKLKKAFYEIEGVDEATVFGNVGNHCKRCDYSDKCPFFRTKK
jgi:CRISPR/Cas system-associated exonuclease Cas4 (RecB family)